MPEFPSSPVSPAELLEGYLPEAFAALTPPPGLEALKLSLGLRLAGEGGGEWVVDLEGGNVAVRPGARDGASFTYVQTVTDWQGALWGGRGSWIGRGAAALFRPDADEAQGALGMFGSTVPMAVEALEEVRGLLGVEVAEDAGAWKLALQLGPGDVPAEPTAVVHVASGDIDEMISGQLQPMEAFMAGRIRVVGDMSLLLQIQAAGMQAMGKLAS